MDDLVDDDLFAAVTGADNGDKDGLRSNLSFDFHFIRQCLINFAANLKKFSYFCKNRTWFSKGKHRIDVGKMKMCSKFEILDVGSEI